MRRLLVATVLVGGCLALPATASGATVSVTESSGTPNKGLLEFRAEPAEANRLTVAVAGESAELYDVRLLDTAAAINPGPGCVGGGAVGEAVHCQMHKPVGLALDPSKCIKSIGCPVIPGTGWTLEMRFALGDGGSHLDAGAIPDPAPTADGTPRVAITVLPGDGADLVTTAGGDDMIESSPGVDTIRTGNGDDTLRGGTAPDGADEVDLGAGRNSADYRERAETVVYKSNDLADDGALGEGDRLLNVKDFQAGAGDDLLEGAGVPMYHVLDESLGGGPGADLIIGGSGNDNLWGGPGNDLVFGQEGEDHLYEALVFEQGPTSGNDVLDGGAGPDTIGASYGDDRVSAGDDQDWVELGPGNDQAEAGAGDDLVRGEGGDDAIRGGAGDDRLVGDNGRDALYGEWGADRLLAGVVVTYLWDRLFLYSGGPVEGAPDTVDCGLGRDDVAGVDRTDSSKGCEETIRLTRLQLLPETFLMRGAAEILYEARVPGRVSISGPGVRPERHHDSAPGEELGARFIVKPAGPARRTLRRHGHVRLRVKVVLRPDSGGKVVRHRWVKIKRKP